MFLSHKLKLCYIYKFRVYMLNEVYVYCLHLVSIVYSCDHTIYITCDYLYTCERSFITCYIYIYIYIYNK